RRTRPGRGPGRVRPAAGGDHQGPGPVAADLLPDGRLRSLRPGGAGLLLGAYRPRPGTAVGGGGLNGTDTGRAQAVVPLAYLARAARLVSAARRAQRRPAMAASWAPGRYRAGRRRGLGVWVDDGAGADDGAGMDDRAEADGTAVTVGSMVVEGTAGSS